MTKMDRYTEQLSYTTEEELKQTNWEQDAITAAMVAFEEQLETESIEGSQTMTNFTTSLLPAVHASIEERQEQIKQSLSDPDTRLKDGEALLLQVRADLLAAAVIQPITSHALASHVGEPVSLWTVLEELVKAYHSAVRLQMWQDEDKKSYDHFWRNNADLLTGTAVQNKRKHRVLSLRLEKQFSKLEEYYEGYELKDERTSLAIADEIMNCVGFTRLQAIKESEQVTFLTENGEDAVTIVDDELYQTTSVTGPCASIFIVACHIESNKDKRYLYLTEAALVSIEDRIESARVSATKPKVMLVPPLNWV